MAMPHPDHERDHSRPPARVTAERRIESRGHFAMLWDPIYALLRASALHANSFVVAVGIFLVSGAAVAIVGTWIFAEVASEVRSGRTQRFDEAVLTWLGQHRIPWIEAAMVEITFLGTATVVLTIVGVAALFLYLTRHKYSAILLLVSTAGGIVLNSILKYHFERPRPQIFTWGTHAVTSSFPSGHATSAAIVYSTVAYLAARLQKHRVARWTTMLMAAVFVTLICGSRLYLGVHYPSDVIAGVAIGLAWAGFCMAALEAIQRFGLRNAPRILQQEEPPPRAAEEPQTTAHPGVPKA
jgi:undecaprenyl-diphosphatase